MALFRLLADSHAETQKWTSEPRDLHASDRLHQPPLVSGTDIAWNHTDYRYQWETNGAPVARPLSGGALVFNERSQWWERNGSSWQPEKKSEGGCQTAIDLRYLGVVPQPRVSRVFGQAMTLLRLRNTFQENARIPKEDHRDVPTIVPEVSNLELRAQSKFDLTADSHILYTQKQPFRIIKSLKRKSCRHPSTCTLHPHINVDVPQTIDVPFVEEPEKLEADQSGFPLLQCQQKGHKHLSHEQDPCFSTAKERGTEVQNQEDATGQVLSFAATGSEAEELETIWQQEEERKRQQEMLMSLPTLCRKEDRPPSISAQTLFHNAAKNLQSCTIPTRRDAQGHSLLPRAADSLNLRGGSGRRHYSRRPFSWKTTEWFTGARRKPISIRFVNSGLDENGTCTR